MGITQCVDKVTWLCVCVCVCVWVWVCIKDSERSIMEEHTIL